MRTIPALQTACEPLFRSPTILMDPASRRAAAANPADPIPRRISHQAGFSLLETLVAFSILAICLGTLLRVFGGGGNAALLTEEYARGLIVAESLLASLDTETELAPGRKQGVVAGSIRWEMQVSPLPVQADNLSDMNFSHTPVWVEVSATWGGDKPRSVRLSTIRLLQAKGSAGPLKIPGSSSSPAVPQSPAVPGFPGGTGASTL